MSGPDGGRQGGGYGARIAAFLAIAAVSIFALAIIVLAIRSLVETTKPAFTEFDGAVFLAISGALATIFGAVVGIGVRERALFSMLRGGERRLRGFRFPTIAELAAIVYAGALLIAGAVVVVDRSAPADALTNMAATLPGVLAGALYTTSNVKPE